MLMKTPWTLVCAASLAVAIMLGLTGTKARADDAANVKMGQDAMTVRRH